MLAASSWVSAGLEHVCLSDPFLELLFVKTTKVTPAQSNSFKVSAAAGNTKFNISFGGGSNVDAGIYMEDTMEVNGVKLDGLTMGLGQDASDHFGILGLSYVQGESAAGENFIYDNFPVALVKSGAASSLAFSMYLNDRSKRPLTLLPASPGRYLHVLTMCCSISFRKLRIRRN